MGKPTDNGQVDACISSLNGPADVRCITPTLEETPRPAQRILANSSNLNTLSPAKTSNLLLDKAVGVPSTALHHLTPVSRPKVRISLGSALHDLTTSERDFRRHSFSEGLDVGTGKQNVNFFHKGRIVPRKSIGALRKQPIVFTLLGKLGPYLDRSSSHPPVYWIHRSSLKNALKIKKLKPIRHHLCLLRQFLPRWNQLKQQWP